ncbi:hypothetical protein ALC56_12068, partial [Trachymyrmex septentrionalis]
NLFIFSRWRRLPISNSFRKDKIICLKHSRRHSLPSLNSLPYRIETGCYSRVSLQYYRDFIWSISINTHYIINHL